ncbi:ribonuclease H-like domain-containing protein [Tanacetum coccineum]
MCDKKNSVLFTDRGCFVLSPDLKLADESQVLLKVPRKNNMYSVDMKNIVPRESSTYLVAKVILDESMLWHRRLGHVNFKTINKLVKKNIVRGLPSKRFENNQTYVACLKGKQHKASCIKREFSIARTPQQNGVAKRRNRTLIEAARTMLADSKLPTTFWAEAVNTACYVQNRVLVVKPHNKTPYELFRGRTPALSFMRPFGCHVTILNTLDYLGKFDGKSDEGFFVGYSLNSKAFKVYNIRTRKVEESLHIRFLEDKPIIAGTNSNNFTRIEESIGAGHSSKDTGSSQDYILMSLWKDGSLFDSSSKNASNDEPQPYSDAGKKDDEVTTAPLKATHADFFSDETEVDMSNITTTYPVHSTPNTRIHKDHSLDHVIGKTHEDLSYLFCLLFPIQERPKKVIQALKDPRWIEAMQEELLQFKIEAIRLFLAYASFKDFVVYQMDVKSAFLHGKIEEEVYVCQPPGFEDPEFPDKVYKMSSMGELTFFLGLQVTQKDDGIFISQDKYMDKILKKFGFSTVKTASTPMETSKPLLKDAEAEDVDVHLYRSMIGYWMLETNARLWGTGSGSGPRCQDTLLGDAKAQIRFEAASNQSNDPPLSKGNTLRSEGHTLNNGEIQITATIDGNIKIITEASIRRHLKLEDSNGISTLPTTGIFKQLALMRIPTKQESKVPQPRSPTQTSVADEAASTGVDVRHGGAAITVSSIDARQGSGNIDKTPTIPYDSPLLRVHTLGSDEGRMQHNELMDLVTKLSDRVVAFFSLKILSRT